MKLVTRLYEPTEGRILLDGKDLRLWDRAALLARFGVVFQDFNQYQLNFRENVGLGNVAHLESVGRIERAVEKSGADHVVAGLASGIETQLGRWFKDGTELSGGQWQKVALARGFMREQADILVLDEPTAALDAEAERAVFERFRRLAKGRTTLIISHAFRPSGWPIGSSSSKNTASRRTASTWTSSPRTGPTPISIGSRPRATPPRRSFGCEVGR